MSVHGDDDFDELGAAPGAAIEALLRLSAGWLLQDPDPQRFAARLAATGPALFPGLFDDLEGGDTARPASEGDRREVERARFVKAFAWAIASATSLSFL